MKSSGSTACSQNSSGAEPVCLVAAATVTISSASRGDWPTWSPKLLAGSSLASAPAICCSNCAFDSADIRCAPTRASAARRSAESTEGFAAQSSLARRPSTSTNWRKPGSNRRA